MKKLLLLTPSLFLVACLGQDDSALKNNPEETAVQQVSSKTAPWLHVEISGRKDSDVQSVIVNVKHIEVHFTKKEKDVRYLLGTQLGPIDLLDASQGLALGLSQFNLPAGSHIKHIRILLEETGHRLIFNDGSMCNLKTPSAQQSGLKINSLQKHQFEAGKDYVLNLAFDTTKGLVVQGNNNCLLKPVLRLGGLVAYVPEVEDPVVVIPGDDGSGEENETPVEDPETETPGDSSGDSSGDSNGDSGTDPGTGTDSGTGTDPVIEDPADDTGDNESQEDDTTGDEEWDYTPIVDGVPTIIP